MRLDISVLYCSLPVSEYLSRRVWKPSIVARHWIIELMKHMLPVLYIPGGVGFDEVVPNEEGNWRLEKDGVTPFNELGLGYVSGDWEGETED